MTIARWMANMWIVNGMLLKDAVASGKKCKCEYLLIMHLFTRHYTMPMVCGMARMVCLYTLWQRLVKALLIHQHNYSPTSGTGARTNSCKQNSYLMSKSSEKSIAAKMKEEKEKMAWQLLKWISKSERNEFMRVVLSLLCAISYQTTYFIILFNY